MRKIKFMLTILLGAGVAGVFAQTPQPTTPQQTDPMIQNPTGIQPQAGRAPTTMEMRDLTKVESTSIPAQVKQSLNTETTYDGWEKGTVYKNKTGDRYVLQIPSQMPDKSADPTTMQSKWYWIDKNGKARALNAD